MMAVDEYELKINGYKIPSGLFLTNEAYVGKTIGQVVDESGPKGKDQKDLLLALLDEADPASFKICKSSYQAGSVEALKRFLYNVSGNISIVMPWLRPVYTRHFHLHLPLPLHLSQFILFIHLHLTLGSGR